ncbi:unnamed protein product [Clavelina lepadiformis]|uniref:GDP-fucose protein O-fucosyltransferase 2 n=1 Tax=Clavelina lepadiformis TaxID=159417 RepID=A0ABP0FKA2_CLALP
MPALLKRGTFTLVLLAATSIFIYHRILKDDAKKFVLRVSSTNFILVDNANANYLPEVPQSWSENEQNEDYFQNRFMKLQKNVAKCSLWKEDEENSIFTFIPQIRLHPGRFLYPGSYGGPNNQIMGLLQSVFLAIRLNRTLVVPRFSTHFTHGKVQIVPAFQRINIRRLCSLVSCISIAKFHNACKGAMDLVFQARTPELEHMRRFERETNMTILREKAKLPKCNGAVELKLSKDTQSSILAYPNSTYNITNDHWLRGNERAIRDVYNTTKPCALHALSYRSINLVAKGQIAFPLRRETYKNVRLIPDDVLYSAIIDSVHPPQCITVAAEEYIASVIERLDYVAVHWRYNEEDWLKLCGQRSERKMMCDALRKITAEDVAEAVVNNLPPLQQKNANSFEDKSGATLPVYISTPPSLKHFKSKILSHLKDLSSQLKIDLMDLEVYLVQAGLAQCLKNANWVSRNEIISLTEMEIVRKSKYFFYSIISTWSSNIRPLRSEWAKEGIRKKFEASVFQLAVDVMTKRSQKK